MKLLSGTAGQKILKLICLAILITCLIVIVVNLSVFHYNINQLDVVIAKDIALKTQRDEKEVSFTTFAVNEQNNVRVVLLQYEGKTGVETGAAIFTKLSLLS